MSGLKCLIPTPAPFVQLSHEWLWASPSPPPQPGHLQSLTPHCCAPLRAREMGPPQGPKGQSWVSPKHPAVLGHRGTVWGSRCAPHASSASALHPGATPPPWCLSAQRGTMVCTFISPPKWGAAREVHRSWALRRSRVLTILDHQVEGSGGRGFPAPLGPLRLRGGPPIC